MGRKTPRKKKEVQPAKNGSVSQKFHELLRIPQIDSKLEHYQVVMRSSLPREQRDATWVALQGERNSVPKEADPVSEASSGDRAVSTASDHFPSRVLGRGLSANPAGLAAVRAAARRARAGSGPGAWLPRNGSRSGRIFAAGSIRGALWRTSARCGCESSGSA